MDRAQMDEGHLSRKAQTPLDSPPHHQVDQVLAANRPVIRSRDWDRRQAQAVFLEMNRPHSSLENSLMSKMAMTELKIQRLAHLLEH